MLSFSPILATIWESSCSTVKEASSIHGSAMNASIVVLLEASTCAATRATYDWNTSFLATKSVSALTSTIAADFLSSETSVATIPSAAILDAFLAAAARPFSLRNSTALSISPSTSFSAFLQSIMPAPVISLNSFTIAAVIAMILFLRYSYNI